MARPTGLYTVRSAYMGGDEIHKQLLHIVELASLPDGFSWEILDRSCVLLSPCPDSLESIWGQLCADSALLVPVCGELFPMCRTCWDPDPAIVAARHEQTLEEDVSPRLPLWGKHLDSLPPASVLQLFCFHFQVCDLFHSQSQHCVCSTCSSFSYARLRFLNSVFICRNV